jgi:hypothetical protein
VFPGGAGGDYVPACGIPFNFRGAVRVADMNRHYVCIEFFIYVLVVAFVVAIINLHVELGDSPTEIIERDETPLR